MPKIRIFLQEQWEEFSFKRKPVTIGRGTENDIHINSSRVSRSHCRIGFFQGNFVLEDMGSKLGTFVNGMRVTRANIGHGDQIRFGDRIEAVFMEDAEVTNTETLRVVTPDWQSDGERLVALNGPFANQSFPLRPHTRIGRGAECEITLPVDTVSQVHAEILKDKEGITVLDRDSANGTFVNEQRTARHRLKPGDVVRFDRISFRFENPHVKIGRGEGTRINGMVPEDDDKTIATPVLAAKDLRAARVSCDPAEKTLLKPSLPMAPGQRLGMDSTQAKVLGTSPWILFGGLALLTAGTLAAAGYYFWKSGLLN